MRKKLINQDGLSNKFWQVDTRGKAQTIVFGKIDTIGREAIKEFASEAECISETNKLIAEKLKKGYVELLENDSIPTKVELQEDEKADIVFWEAIKKTNKYKGSNWEDYDIDEHIENLTELLAKSGKQTLVQFEKCLQEKLHELYTAEIAELFIILHSEFKEKNEEISFDAYVSDDGFVYFRCWIILLGETFFNEMKDSIKHFTTTKTNFFIDDCWAEGLLYVADEAYGENHDNPDDDIISNAVRELYPDVMHYDSMERKLDREPKGGAELQKMYPEIVKIVCELRNENDD
jgi:predicted DNA-binding WGR domain protein